MESSKPKPILHFKRLPNHEFEVYSPFHEGIEGNDSNWSYDQWVLICQTILEQLFGSLPLTLILPDWSEQDALYSDFPNREARLLKEILSKDEKVGRRRKVWFAFVTELDDSFWKLLISSTEFLMDAVLLTNIPPSEIHDVYRSYAEYWQSQSLQSMKIGIWAIPIGDGYGLNLKLDDQTADGFEQFVESVAHQVDWDFRVAKP